MKLISPDMLKVVFVYFGHTIPKECEKKAITVFDNVIRMQGLNFKSGNCILYLQIADV